jgi:hypothetical protein
MKTDSKFDALFEAIYADLNNKFSYAAPGATIQNNAQVSQFVGLLMQFVSDNGHFPTELNNLNDMPPGENTTKAYEEFWNKVITEFAKAHPEVVNRPSFQQIRQRLPSYIVSIHRNDQEGSENMAKYDAAFANTPPDKKSSFKQYLKAAKFKGGTEGDVGIPEYTNKKYGPWAGGIHRGDEKTGEQ